MHHNRSSHSDIRGSALITVIFLMFMMALLSASMLNYTLNERRGNERNRLILRAKNMAENVTLYSSEQIGTKLYRLRTIAEMEFAGSNAITLPPASLLTTPFSSASDVEVYAGITATSPLTLITDTDDPNCGLQVTTGTVPIIAKSTMTHPAMGSITAYAEQTLQASMVPLFQFAIFYNKDLEFSPGANMVISGPVHSNGRLIARCQTGFTNTVEFRDRVTVVEGFYANTAHLGTIWNEYDSADSGPGGTGPLYFNDPDHNHTNVKSSSTWRDHKYGLSTESETTKSQFATFANTYYKGNLRTSVHQVGELNLPGLDDTSANNGRTTIEPAADSDSATLKQTKFSRNAGLYIIANPDDDVRTGRLPDNDTVTMLPRSYRCWLNTVNSNGTYTLREVILPGQPSYGYNNNGTPFDSTDDYMYRNYLPNRYTTATSVGSNQVLRMPQQNYGSGRDYLLNGAHVTGVTTITVDTGLGGIYAGDTVTIGASRYLVMTDLTAGSFTISAPGLRADASDNVAVTVNTPHGAVGTAGSNFDIDLAGGYAIGATTLNLDGTTGTIWPGNTIDIGSYHYLVTATPNSAPGSSTANHLISIAAPGLRASVSNDAPVAIDSNSGTLGSAYRFFINNAAGYAAGATSLALDGDTGTIRPGSTILIGTDRYLVTSTPDTDLVATGNITLATGLTAAVTDDAMVTVDPFPNSGYGVGTATLTNASTVIPDAYFYDLRRATNSNGHPFSRPSNTFIPRPIAKIDFDMARFKMCVNRTLSATVATLLSTDTTTTGYNVDVPNGANWNNNILKSDATTTTLHHGLGGSYNVMPATTDVATRTRLDPFRIYFAPTGSVPPPYASTEEALADDPSVYGVGSSSLSSPWFDGITVYIHSAAAETLTESSAGVRDRIDSGVRLWNGRGPAVSLSTAGLTGFSISTNDPAYIVGHFNADGSIDSSDSDEGTGSPNYYDGYSAQYPDSADEKLTSVMSDAITILSQPVFVLSGSTYVQSSGWSDSLSGTRVRTTNWGSSWATTNPGGSNAVDGVNTSIVPALMPNRGTNAPNGGSSRNIKFAPTVSEVSACLLTGIVPTDSHQSSGGVHNFPRLLEAWSGTGLYIRGSMVAMFASEIATEPWSIRIYSGAGRYWGLHWNLRSEGHDVPLEPILYGASRLRYTELTAAEYAAQKAIIEAL